MPTAAVTQVVVDPGPCHNAAYHLVENSTLNGHVLAHPRVPGDDVWVFSHDPDGVPFDVWGSGTQGLWSFLCSMVTSREDVNLYRVVSRLDAHNTRAVAEAFTLLCGGTP